MLQARANVANSALGTTIGATAPMTETGYQSVAARKSDLEMAQFMARVLDVDMKTITSEEDFLGMVPLFSGTRAVQSLKHWQDEIRNQPWIVDLQNGDFPSLVQIWETSEMPSLPFKFSWAALWDKMTGKTRSTESEAVGKTPKEQKQIIEDKIKDHELTKKSDKKEKKSEKSDKSDMKEEALSKKAEQKEKAETQTFDRNDAAMEKEFDQAKRAKAVAPAAAVIAAPAKVSKQPQTTVTQNGQAHVTQHAAAPPAKEQPEKTTSQQGKEHVSQQATKPATAAKASSRP